MVSCLRQLPENDGTASQVKDVWTIRQGSSGRSNLVLIQVVVLILSIILLLPIPIFPQRPTRSSLIYSSFFHPKFDHDGHILKGQFEELNQPHVKPRMDQKIVDGKSFDHFLLESLKKEIEHEISEMKVPSSELTMQIGFDPNDKPLPPLPLQINKGRKEAKLDLLNKLDKGEDVIFTKDNSQLVDELLTELKGME